MGGAGGECASDCGVMVILVVLPASSSHNHSGGTTPDASSPGKGAWIRLTHPGTPCTGITLFPTVSNASLWGIQHYTTDPLCCLEHKGHYKELSTNIY